MTDINKYNPYPDICIIRCPVCGGPAEFRFAFTLLGERQYSEFQTKMWPWAETARWGGWYVIQHDPALYRWKPPPQGYERNNDGIRMCAVCVGRAKHRLDWPTDAFYRFELREGLLWAWTFDHASALADFIESKERDPGQHGYFLFLRHIPKEFLDRRCRDRVVREIRKKIGGQQRRPPNRDSATLHPGR